MPYGAHRAAGLLGNRFLVILSHGSFLGPSNGQRDQTDYAMFCLSGYKL